MTHATKPTMRLDRARWEANLRPAEVAAWATWLDVAREGADKDVLDDFSWRIGQRADVRDKDMYAPYLRGACPPGSDAHVLDVGAGPLTFFPRSWFTRNYRVTPVDPLAGEYDKLLAAHRYEPQFRTIPGEAETLVEQFGADQFHLVFCRNALEQCYDPMEAIRQMLAVVKPGCWVLLQQEGYRGEEELPRTPWSLEEDDNDLFLVARDGGGGTDSGERVDLGMAFADVATLRVSRSWHWPWLLAGLKKEPTSKL